MKFSSSIALVALTGVVSAAPAAERRQEGAAANSAGFGNFGAGSAQPTGFGGLGAASPSGLGAADGGHFQGGVGRFDVAGYGAGSASPTGSFGSGSGFGGSAAPSGSFPQGGASPSGSALQRRQLDYHNSGLFGGGLDQSASPVPLGAGSAAPTGAASEEIWRRQFGDDSVGDFSALPSGTPSPSGFPGHGGRGGHHHGSAAPSHSPAARAHYRRQFGQGHPGHEGGHAAPSGIASPSGFTPSGGASPSGSAISIPLHKRQFGDSSSGGFGGHFPGGFGGSASPSDSFGSGSASPSGSFGSGSSSPSGSAAASGSFPSVGAKVAASGVSYSAAGTGTAASSVSTGSSSSTNSSSSASTTDGPIGYASTNGGTTGGEGGTTTTVSSLAEFTAAATADEATVVYISGTISGSTQVKVTSDTSILGLNSDSALEGIGLYVKGVSNVILRNFASSKVLADNGDAIGIQASSNVWADHLDLSSDLDHGKDYYDGLIDVTHASEWVTISNVYFHDHYKASLVGHSDSNGDEDTGHLHVTYANNYWSNISSRTPSIRFGTGHIINSYFSGLLSSGIDTRDGAQVLVESNVFADSKDPLASLYSDDQGYATVDDNDFGSGEDTAPAGNLTSVPYEYTLLGSANVKAAVVGTAGNTLTLG